MFTPGSRSIIVNSSCATTGVWTITLCPSDSHRLSGDMNKQDPESRSGLPGFWSIRTRGSRRPCSYREDPRALCPETVFKENASNIYQPLKCTREALLIPRSTVTKSLSGAGGVIRVGLTVAVFYTSPTIFDIHFSHFCTASPR